MDLNSIIVFIDLQQALKLKLHMKRYVNNRL